MTVMTRTTTTEVNDIYNIRTVLQNARAKFAYALFGQEDEIAERNGDTIKWYTVGDLTEQTATLADSPTWNPEAASVTSQTAQLALYGNGVELVETLRKTSVLDLPQILLERIGENAGKSIDGRVRAIVLGGSGVTYANSKTTANITTADVASYTNIVDVAAALETKDVPKFTHPKRGEVYVAIISPMVKARLMKDADFRELIKNGQQEKAWKGELGEVDGVVFIVTSRATTATVNSVTCDQTAVLGKGAYGVASMPLDGNASARRDGPTTYQADNDYWTDERINNMFEVVITPPGGHGDEFKVKTAIAWKAFFAAKILNQDYMTRFVSAR